jgi:hypothetical protein
MRRGRRFNIDHHAGTDEPHVSEYTFIAEVKKHDDRVKKRRPTDRA